MAQCIFCKIIDDTLPSTKLYEDKDFIVIKDIAPQAPIHYLIIPKKHCSDLRDFCPNEPAQAGQLLAIARQLSASLNNQDFRLTIANGANAGQEIFHLHAHFLAQSPDSDTTIL